jgi:sirohydrochlorin ferrochelatase
MSSHVATSLELPGELDSARRELLSICPTELSEMRVDWPPPVEISTPFGEHHPIVALLGWAAIGLPHPEGWMSTGRTTPRDAHGTEWLLVAAIDGVEAVALAPIRAIARTIRRNMTTPHCGIPLSSIAPQGSGRFHD